MLRWSPTTPNVCTNMRSLRSFRWNVNMKKDATLVFGGLVFRLFSYLQSAHQRFHSSTSTHSLSLLPSYIFRGIIPFHFVWLFFFYESHPFTFVAVCDFEFHMLWLNVLQLQAVDDCAAVAWAIVGGSWCVPEMDTFGMVSSFECHMNC